MASRSPALKPCFVNAAAIRPTRACSSRKVERVPFAASAVRSGKYRAARPSEWMQIMRTLSVALDTHLSGVASRDEDEIEHGQRETERPPKARPKQSGRTRCHSISG